MTLKELVKEGHVNSTWRPVPMQMIFDSKTNPDGSFNKAKARYVLQGDKRHMKKDVHYSVVFAPSPALATTRLIQAYAVGHSKYRFGFDVDQAFLHAESTPQEQIAIRFADGIREYNENGEELHLARLEGHRCKSINTPKRVDNSPA